ncbi:hypothetical protein [Bordetella genomosp. 9]|uniref:Uncharacterized protein n=1 Tax=Bordetella genomosp. 9 TaxID=1416803 RepID=A0A1W6Z512_9BORD|nr:hypothetical protein [Bordetella genomosp. 9]ARP88189.1 hypothetical protein CAL13_19715 [Bordetella genomosp. 9]
MNHPAEPPSYVPLAALLQEIGPLPLSGQAWPDWVKILVWVLLAALGWEIVTTIIQLSSGNLNPLMVAGVAVCFLGLGVVAWFMQTSITTIDGRGLKQTWLTRREVAWQDIRSARFVPLIFSKRLIVVTRAGRPMVFQGGTRELEKAFIRIAAAYHGAAGRG